MTSSSQDKTLDNAKKLCSQLSSVLGRNVWVHGLELDGDRADPGDELTLQVGGGELVTISGGLFKTLNWFTRRALIRKVVRSIKASKKPKRNGLAWRVGVS